MRRGSTRWAFLAFLGGVLTAALGGCGEAPPSGEREPAKPAVGTSDMPEQKPYRDQNGYFAALPPAGWSQEDYPEETIRSKVAFHGPEGVTIRIIAGPTPTPGYSLDDLYRENKAKCETVLPAKFPNGTFAVKRGKLGERDAVLQTASIPSASEQEVVMAIHKGVWYSISFAAGDHDTFTQHHPHFERFCADFLIMDSDRKFSDAEVAAGLAASKKRLAELHAAAGHQAEALQYVKEGLALDPTNKALQEMKADLEAKLGQK